MSNLFRIAFFATVFRFALLVPGSLHGQPQAARKFSVADFGASGNGKTKDTAAIQKAIDACAQAGGGDVEFSARTYLAGSINLKSHVHLVLPRGAVIQGSGDTADYPLATARWAGLEEPAYLALVRASHAEDIAITGSGVIQGDTAIGKLRNPRAPTLIEPIECRNIRLDGMTLRGNKIWTVHPIYCQNVAISNLIIQTTDWNSDGIDPDSCQHVTIDHCSFETGDDNIAIKSGKGQEGVRVARPSEDIAISNCIFIKGYCSIALGSEVSGGIRDIHIQHCIFKQGRCALYLKSSPGRAGYIRNVTADDIDVGPEPLLEIDTDYTGNPDIQGVPGLLGLTKIENIAINNARIHCNKAVTFAAAVDNPADGITLSDIKGSCVQPWIFKNVTGVTLKGIHVTGFEKEFLSLENASGAGLDQANH